jgi:hypothetical protein
MLVDVCLVPFISSWNYFESGHHDTQHNDTYNKGLFVTLIINDTEHVMHSTCKTFIMQNVVMLSVAFYLLVC